MAAGFTLSLVASASACSCIEGGAVNALQSDELIGQGKILAVNGPYPLSSDCAALEAEVDRICVGSEGRECRNPYLKKLAACYGSRASVDVQLTEIWKGSFGERVTIHFFPAIGTSCDMHFAVGQEGVIAASLDVLGNLNVNLCTPRPHLEILIGQPQIVKGEKELLDRYRARWHELKDAADLSPQDQAAWLALAQFLEQSNDRTGAIAAYQRIIQIAPDSAVGYAGVGRVLSASDRFSDAAPLLKAALQKDPGNTEIERLYRRAQLKNSCAPLPPTVERPDGCDSLD